MNDNWEEYYRRLKGKPPRPLLVKALAFVGNKHAALDLGAVALNDSIYLLLQGIVFSRRRSYGSNWKRRNEVLAFVSYYC